MRYLIAEDKEKYRDVVKKVIKKSGNEVIFATNYKNAEKLLQTEKFDRVITDLFFPESDKKDVGKRGKQLLAFLKSVKTEEICRYNDPYAPLGLYIFGMACLKKIPAIIASQGSCHHGSFGFVRYKIERITKISINNFIACSDGDWKNSTTPWERIVDEKPNASSDYGINFCFAIRNIPATMSKVDLMVREKFFGF